MSFTPKVLAFAGSLRKASWNKKLVRIAAEAVRAAGGEVTLVELNDFPLPIFDEDSEARDGLPENARKLKDLMLAHQGFLISSPEYNSSITPLVKNTIDWTSRGRPGETPLACYAGKTAVLISASPGALGGMRALVHLRAILGNIGTLVLPATISIAKAPEAFAEDGSLKDKNQQQKIEKLAAGLVAFLRKHYEPEVPL
jgi:chromate reductase, NAD(P)H dehydrogenase (quinone)